MPLLYAAAVTPDQRGEGRFRTIRSRKSEKGQPSRPRAGTSLHPDPAPAQGPYALNTVLWPRPSLRGHAGRSASGDPGPTRTTACRSGSDRAAAARPFASPLATSGPRLSLRSAGVTLDKTADPLIFERKRSQSHKSKPKSQRRPGLEPGPPKSARWPRLEAGAATSLTHASSLPVSRKPPDWRCHSCA